MPIWPLFLYLFVFEKILKETMAITWHFTTLVPDLRKHTLFHFPRVYFFRLPSNLGIGPPVQAAWSRPMESFNGFQAVEVWRIPLGPPKKKWHHLITGKQGLVLCIFTVSSIQEAKLVCIVFFSKCWWVIIHWRPLNWKILKISTRISKVYSGSQLWRLTQGASTGKFISWKKAPPMVLQGKILVETLLDANIQEPPLKPSIPFFAIQKFNTKKSQKKNGSNRSAPVFFFQLSSGLLLFEQDVLRPKLCPWHKETRRDFLLMGIILVSLDSAISRGYIKSGWCKILSINSTNYWHVLSIFK